MMAITITMTKIPKEGIQRLNALLNPINAFREASSFQDALNWVRVDSPSDQTQLVFEAKANFHSSAEKRRKERGEVYC